MDEKQRARLEKMAEWLEDGAPHVVFDMGTGRENIGYALQQAQAWYPEEDTYQNMLVERDVKGLGDCGSVCCIAGYAVEAFASAKEKEKIGDHWEAIALYAKGAFGLEQERPNDQWMHHDLFDSVLAPKNCSPKQAAQAVRNLLNSGTTDMNPWEGVE